MVPYRPAGGARAREWIARCLQGQLRPSRKGATGSPERLTAVEASRQNMGIEGVMEQTGISSPVLLRSRSDGVCRTLLSKENQENAQLRNQTCNLAYEGGPT